MCCTYGKNRNGENETSEKDKILVCSAFRGKNWVIKVSLANRCEVVFRWVVGGCYITDEHCGSCLIWAVSVPELSAVWMYSVNVVVTVSRPKCLGNFIELH